MSLLNNIPRNVVYVTFSIILVYAVFHFLDHGNVKNTLFILLITLFIGILLMLGIGLINSISKKTK